MKVVIFCGGQGLRMREASEVAPKPMIPIGSRPVLWHVMKYYAHFGFTDFVLCLGYKAEVIKQFFLTYNEAMANDFVLTNGGADVHLLKTDIHDWNITFVDTGLHKVARYDPARAIDSLEVERIPQDSADQRAGRAGRVAAGAVWRLWRAADRLRPSAQAEIHRIDLAAVVLAVLSWGGDPYNLAWFEPPARYSLDAAFELLRGLGAEARSAVIYGKPRSVIRPDYLWKATDDWIVFPWSAAPPVTAGA